jgi:hypothetical protein
MRNFYEWLLNEGFELPYRVVKDMYEYLVELYKIYEEKPRTTLKPKYFDLDLTGTRYDFVMTLNPKIHLVPMSRIANYYGLCHKPSYIIENNIIKWVTKIEISFENFIEHGLNTLYHEVLHAVQDLIRIKKNVGIIGGLPNMPLVKRIMDEKGINVYGRMNVKRIKHQLRPVEFYTNLETVIKELQFIYLKHLTYLGKDIYEGVRDVEAKKQFFAKARQIGSGGFLGQYRIMYLKNVLDSVKTDDELYKIYLQEIAKRFILNNDFIPDILSNYNIFKNNHENILMNRAEKEGLSYEEIKEKSKIEYQQSFNNSVEYYARKKQEEDAVEAEKRKKEAAEEAEKRKKKAAEKADEKVGEKEKAKEIINIMNKAIEDKNYSKEFEVEFDFKKLNIFVQRELPKIIPYISVGAETYGNGQRVRFLARWNAKKATADWLERFLNAIGLKAGYKNISARDSEEYYPVISKWDQKVIELWTLVNMRNNIAFERLVYNRDGVIKKCKEFYDGFALKLAEVTSDALGMGSYGKKYIFDTFYNFDKKVEF